MKKKKNVCDEVIVIYLSLGWGKVPENRSIFPLLRPIKPVSLSHVTVALD